MQMMDKLYMLRKENNTFPSHGAFMLNKIF